MSSTDPFQLLSGTERWTASLDALRQRQQELANRLTQAQKQAAQPLATKMPPSPATTAQALHARFTNQFAKVTATVQQQQAAYRDAVAKGDLAAAHGHLTAARDAWQQLQGAGEVASAGLEYQAKQAEAERAELEARAKLYGHQVQDINDAVQNMRDMMQDVRQKVGDIMQAQDQVVSKIWS
jgi:chromosome segregation ATPase